MPVRWLYERLLSVYGPQGWWPANDPFEVMVGAVLVQQTSWSSVEKAIAALRAAGRLHWMPLASTPLARLETLIRPVGFYRVKARRLRGLAEFVGGAGGIDALTRRSSPELRNALLGLPGVGEETADAMLLYAFERPAGVIDAYTRQLFSRFAGAAAADTELRAAVLAALTSVRELNEFHALVVEHGKRHCGKTPSCEACCLQARCAQG